MASTMYRLTSYMEDQVRKMLGKLAPGKSPDSIVLSGYRLGRFEGDLGKISNYLNSMPEWDPAS